MMYEVVKHDQEMMRKINKGNILNLIREKKPVSRSELAKITGMSPTSVGRIVSELIELGLIKETELASSKVVGRKALLLDTEPNSVYAVCVQIDEDVSRIGIIDFDGTIIEERSCICDAHSMDWREFSNRICEEIEKIIAETYFEKSKIIGVGIGLPGLIDNVNGIVLFSPQLRWENVKLTEYFKNRLGYHITIDNVIKAKALAENTYGSARDAKRMVFVHFGTGVGSALIVDNRIYRGITNSAGEIGHTTINPNGRLCDCGRRGCLQTYITERALLQEARTIKDISGIDEIFEASSRGEGWAASIVDNLHTYISIAICNIICMYNPNAVIIGGKMMKQPPEVESIIKGKVDKLIWAQFKGSYEIKCSSLGERAGMLGMSILLVNQYIDIEL